MYHKVPMGSEKNNKILKCLLNNDLTQKQISKKTNISEATTSRLLKKLNMHIDYKPIIPPKNLISLKIDLNPFLKILDFTLHNFNEEENKELMSSNFYKNCLKNNEIQDFIFLICTPARNMAFSNILLYLESRNNELIHKFKNFFTNAVDTADALYNSHGIPGYIVIDDHARAV